MSGRVFVFFVAKPHPKEIRNKALELFLSGKTLEEVSKELDIAFKTITAWHERDKWAEAKADNAVKVREKVKKKAAKVVVAKELTVLDKSRKSQEFLHKFKDTVQDAQDAAVFINAEAKLLTIEGKITGELVEKTKHEGKIQLEVKPLLGGESVKSTNPD